MKPAKEYRRLRFLIPLALLGSTAGATDDAAAPVSQISKSAPETRIRARVHDETTTETDIIEKEIRQVRTSRHPTEPFRIKVRTEERCDLLTIPNTPAGLFFKDYFEGYRHDVYLVDPRHVDESTGRWTRSYTGETECKVLAAPPPARATSDSLSKQVSGITILPSPQLGVSPTGRGLTGLPVTLWADGVPTDWLAFPPTVLDGKQVEVQARPTGYSWDTGDSGTSAPQSTYSTDGPGSPDVPAVTHVYETKSSVGRPAEGVYTIRLDVIWARRYRVVGIADACNDWCNLDPGKTSSSRSYQVDEVRAALTG